MPKFRKSPAANSPAAAPAEKPAAEVVSFAPQPGPQTMFLSSSADVVIYGGSAGGGKSYALLLEPLRHITSVTGFGAVIFRRESPQITNEGGLWDTSQGIYGYFNGQPKVSLLRWDFPNGNSIRFAHLELEKDVRSWDGSQIPLLGFDELEHFSKSQFLYMLSRNRSLCGVPPYIRATCNPEPQSWILELIGWWIDDAGYAIKERSGVVRYFATVSGQFVTANTPEELLEKYPGCAPKSFTFIHASIEDNAKLMQIDPGYVSNLKALPEHERERLLKGNWKVKRQGPLWKWGWFQRCEPAAVPALTRVVVGVDPSGGSGKGNDAQGIVAVGRGEDGRYYVLEDATCKLTPRGWGEAAVSLYETRRADVIAVESNFGGEMVESTLRQVAPEANVKRVHASRGKAIRAEPIAALYEKGKVVHAGFFTALENEMVGFDPERKGQGSPNRMDALVWAITEMLASSHEGLLEYYREKTGRPPGPASVLS